MAEQEQKIVATLDMTGCFCPEPIIRISEEIANIGLGEIMEMLADDPSAGSDMKSWAKRTGHELVLVEESDGVARFLVRRTG